MTGYMIILACFRFSLTSIVQKNKGQESKKTGKVIIRIKQNYNVNYMHNYLTDTRKLLVRPVAPLNLSRQTIAM